jgi:hypothetical protein
MASKTIKQRRTKREQAVFELAESTMDKEGELEFDIFCAVSEGDDNGAYVQAWVWVPFDGTALCKGDTVKGNHLDCSQGCPVWDAL